MNNIAKKIDKLRHDRKWTVYRLSKESGLPAPTIRKWFAAEMFPSIPALMQICEAFGITLADFFADGSLIELTSDKKELYNDWCSLTQNEQAAVLAIIKSFKDKK